VPVVHKVIIVRLIPQLYMWVNNQFYYKVALSAYLLNMLKRKRWCVLGTSVAAHSSS